MIARSRVQIPHLTFLAVSQLPLSRVLAIVITIILLQTTVNATSINEQSSGDYLGEMTNDLSEYGLGSYILEFVSGDSKEC